jgi:hypothetical protein
MEEHEREDEDEHAILKDEQSFIDNISRFYEYSLPPFVL